MFAIGLILFLLGMFGSSFTKPGWLEAPSNAYFGWLITLNVGVVGMVLSIVVLAWRALP